MRCVSASAALLLILVVIGLKAQNSPALTLRTISTTASSTTVSVTAVDFNNIISCDLKIIYDPEVAMPSRVTLGPEMKGTFAYNLNDRGIVRIGWFTYPSLTLTDSSVIFNIEFTRISIGTSIIRFDDGTVSPADCQFYDGSFKKLNDLPFSKYYLPGSLTFMEPAGPVTTAPVLAAMPDEEIAVPITVVAFRNVGAVSLMLEYDPAVLDFISAENTGGFPGMLIQNTTPGTITVSGTFDDQDGYSLPDDTVFFILNFRYLEGSTHLSWNDEDGRSCKYAGPQSSYCFTDTPQQEYYINGKVEPGTVPVAPSLSLTHPSCAVSTGEIKVTTPLGAEYSYSIDGTNYQRDPVFTELFSGAYNVTVINNLGYVSSITTAIIEKQPHTAGPAIETTAPTCRETSRVFITNYNPDYIYSFSPEGPVADAGGVITGFITGQAYTLTATGNDGCESAPSESFIAWDVLEAPEPLIVAEYTDEGSVILTASEGVDYLWSTGETTQSITVTGSGEYTVEVTWENGCSAISAPISIILSNTQNFEKTNASVDIKAYPNPFAEQLTIEFISPASGHACLEIYDLHGRLVQTVFNQKVEAGIVYSTAFIPKTETDCTYIYRMNLDGKVHTGTVMYKK